MPASKVQPLSHDAGLSLVEVMVSLFIVGLTTSFIVVSLPSNDSSSRKVQEQFRLQLDTLKNLSVMTGEPFGVEIDDYGSQAVVFRRGEWVSHQALDELAHISWSEEFKVDVVREARQSFSKSKILNEEDPPIEPEVWFDPSGIAQAHDLTLISGKKEQRLTVSLEGVVNVSQRQ